MFREILVPLDGSGFAEAALPLACRLARVGQAHLHLALAHQPLSALVPVGEPALLAGEPGRALGGREGSYLDETATAMNQPGFAQVEFRELEGPPGPRVCEEVARVGADLVVIATHSRGALGRLCLGGVADYLVRHLTVPVLLVHPDSARVERRNPPVRSILVALDLSSAAEAILAPVTALAQLSQAHVTLMHVVERVFEISSPGDLHPVHNAARTQASQVEAQRRLDRIADRLSERGLSVSTRVVVGINAAGGLLDALASTRYDVLALTTHGAGGLRRLLLGSVADQVIRRTIKPVLVLRPKPEN